MAIRDDVEFIRKYPDKCCSAVSRDGESQPCDKVAVAVCAGVADDSEDDPHWWPVCAGHTRKGWMVPLEDLLKVLS